MSLNIKIEDFIEKYLGYELKYPNNKYGTYDGRWRYQNWQSDVNDNIWSIHFETYKVYSYTRYEKDLENIEKFRFIGLKSGEVILTNINIDIAFSLIKELIEREQLVKSLEKKSKDELFKFNDGDISFIRDYKLLLLDID
jgi:hypothetical protein